MADASGAARVSILNFVLGVPSKDDRASFTPVPNGLRARFVDSDGQPLNLHLNEWRRSDRAIHELIGIIKGILADGTVEPTEIITLCDWLLVNAERSPVWPIDVVYNRIARIVHDGKIGREECDDLAHVFRKIGDTRSLAEGFNDSISLPLTEPPPELTFLGMKYVLTGKFYYGPRTKCESEIEARGGLCHETVTKDADVLVIGANGSRDWIHTSFGRKIEVAVNNIRDGCETVIVSEQHWTRHL